MFQKPGDLLNSEMEETIRDCTPPQMPCKEFMKTDECQILPCFGVKNDMLKRIDHKTVCDLLLGGSMNTDTVVVGCFRWTICAFV